MNKTRIKTEFEITMTTSIYSIISLQFYLKYLPPYDVRILVEDKSDSMEGCGGHKIPPQV